MRNAIKYFLGTRGPSGFGSGDTAEKVSEGISLHGRTIIVTGATAGIGVETARVLALRGATVVIAARNVTKAEGVKADILKKIPGAKVEVRELDVASLASVRKFGEAWNAEKRPLHILINNAGILNSKYRTSVDGHEAMFATNHLGHFLLTELLIENIIATAKESGIEGRVVNVSSIAHSFLNSDTIPFEDVDDPKKFSPWHHYAISKIANVQHANELSRRLKERGANVTANSLHPGVIATTVTVDYLGPIIWRLYKTLCYPFIKSTAQGAATTVYVAVSPALNGVAGKYFVHCNIAETKTKVNKDEKVAADLWEFSKRLTAP